MAVTVTDLYTARGLSLKPKGTGGSRGPEFCGPCPGCGGEDRFLVWPEQNGGGGSWACRGCGGAGDAIQFLREFDGMSFHEAARAVGRDVAPGRARACPQPPAPEKKFALSSAEAEVAGEIWRTKAGNFAAVCHAALLQETRVLEWLHERGLDEIAVRRFCLGWNAGDGKHPHLMRPRSVWGLPDLRDKGGKLKRAIWLPRGLVIPQLGVGGSVLRLRIRRPESDRVDIPIPYYVVPGSGMSPLWLQQKLGTLPADAAALIVESELDAMACAAAAGDLCSVLGIMTARIRTLPPEVMRSLRACARILVATDIGDPDHAGGKGWEIWRDTFPQARRWPCLDGKDPGDMVKAGRSIRSWVLAGLPEVYAALAAGKRDAACCSETTPTAAPVAACVAVPVGAGACTGGSTDRASGDSALVDDVAAARVDEDEDEEGGLPPEAWGVEPWDRLCYPRGGGDVLRVLERAGLQVEARKGDFRIYGHEGWPFEGKGRLLAWMKNYSVLIMDALYAENPGPAL
jgi:hypothetical protein